MIVLILGLFFVAFVLIGAYFSLWPPAERKKPFFSAKKLRVIEKSKKQSVSTNLCSVDYCKSRSDPRCVAQNCTFHCMSPILCQGTCISVWAEKEKQKLHTEEQENLKKFLKEKAPLEE